MAIDAAGLAVLARLASGAWGDADAALGAECAAKPGGANVDARAVLAFGGKRVAAAIGACETGSAEEGTRLAEEACGACCTECAADAIAAVRIASSTRGADDTVAATRSDRRASDTRLRCIRAVERRGAVGVRDASRSCAEGCAT